MIIDYLCRYPEHLQTVGKWLFNEWGHYYEGYSEKDWVSGLETRMDFKRIPFIFVAIVRDKAVATASIVKEDMSTHKYLTPWLASVYVDANYRRKKIGTRIVLKIEEEARDMGIRKLYLFTPDMKKFYENIGWTVFEEPQYRGERVFLMVKDL